MLPDDKLTGNFGSANGKTVMNLLKDPVHRGLQDL